MAEERFGRAINRALDDSMAADPAIVLIGEDVAHAGGSFGVTRGLMDKYGEDRVRDTPISESTIVSAAVGAAMSGLKPVVEIMFMDFVTLAMDALVNQAAKARFMFGGQCSIPMVLRTPHGGGVNAGPQHSQCLEAWLAHIPGLKVVCPSNPGDAYWLFRAAIDDPDPVIFIEHKNLYAAKGEIDSKSQAGIGSAKRVRSGANCTVVTYGRAVNLALGAADELAEQGMDLDILDLCSLQPWDEQAVLDSLKKTHRLVVFHEAVTQFGVGAEIVARMADIGFDELDAPIVRAGAPFMPVPFAESLEEQYLPSSKDLIDAVRKVFE